MDFILALGSEVSQREFPKKIKTILNFLFVASITSVAFKKIYYDYYLLDITDYSAIYEFVIEGHFFIPCIVFYLIWMSTDRIGILLFSLPNMLIQRRLRKKLLRFSFEKMKWFNQADEKAKIAIDKFIQFPNDKVFDALILEVNKAIKQEDLKQLHSGIEEGKNKVEKQFVLVLRASVATTIYFLTLPYFGWGLFITLIVLIIFSTVLLTVANQCIQILPTVLGLIESISSNSEVKSHS